MPSVASRGVGNTARSLRLQGLGDLDQKMCVSGMVSLKFYNGITSARYWGHESRGRAILSTVASLATCFSLTATFAPNSTNNGSAYSPTIGLSSHHHPWI